MVDPATLVQLIGSGASLLVDFFADWCVPCRVLPPEMRKLSAAYAGVVRVVKFDVDTDPSVAQALKIFGIPTVIHFAAGREVARSSGAQPGCAARVVTRTRSARVLTNSGQGEPDITEVTGEGQAASAGHDAGATPLANPARVETSGRAPELGLETVQMGGLIGRRRRARAISEEPG